MEEGHREAPASASLEAQSPPADLGEVVPGEALQLSCKSSRCQGDEDQEKGGCQLAGPKAAAMRRGSLQREEDVSGALGAVWTSSSGYVAAMPLLINSANRQVAGFAVATIGWILGTVSMGLVEWRIWYMNNTSLFPSRLASVGMWRVCIYHHVNNSSRATTCHHYTYHDTYLPLDIRVPQNLLLVASILGLLEKASIIFALRNVYIGILEKKATCNSFITSGILNIAAGICIFMAVFWNYYSVMNKEGIAFPPSFNMPFKPDTQRIGSAIVVACLAAFMILLSGLFFLSYKFPLDSQVHPEVSEM
ncbi:claudin-34 isoform X1 [Camelus dromedarius]|uniref:Claudin-34 isoform X1 n=2 Tax=Camelus ferus TaxID=419612 RepID=A0A8B8SJT7_CAMFR|nr:claudin-34 isoform X1 [Camelus ferus]